MVILLCSLTLSGYLRAQDVNDLKWRGDALVVRICEHHGEFVWLGPPEAVVGLDASIGGCLCITEVIAKGQYVLRIFTELFQGVFEEGGIATRLPDASAVDIFTADAVDLVFREDFLQSEGSNGDVQHFAVVARHDGGLDVVDFDVLENLLPPVVERTHLDVLEILFTCL